MSSPGKYASSSRAGSAPSVAEKHAHPSLNTVRRAVVIECLNDLSYWSPQELLAIYESIANKGLLQFDPSTDNPEDLKYIIPKNSIICQLVTDGGGRGAPTPSMACPMFSSHLMMPVKAGEQVWIFQEKPVNDYENLFWMCRIPGAGYVEDVNYSHSDRGISKRPGETNPGFPNGLGNRFTIGENPSAYDIINSISRANLSYRPESVPRLTKRPGDLVIQGSNNATIILGEDRGWTSEDRPDGSEFSNASKTDEEREKLGCGTIDLVAGRGRFIPDVGDDPTGTANKVIINTRNFEENDKYHVNPAEGDPDFMSDSSRVYASMNTNGDANFGLEYPSINGVETPLVEESPYVILKSDEIRIVARRDSENDINGSVKIVKEGVADSEGGDGRAVIMLQPDGTIVIDGPKIVIGSGIEKGNGLGAQVEIGDGAVEPIVLGEKLKSLLEDLIDTFINNGTASLATSAVGPTALNPLIIADLTSIRAQLITTLSKVGKTK